jgi:YidC/Oxa1 family membrane protein insertase
MAEEVRAREAQIGSPAKELVEHGYGRLDAILAAATPTDRAASSHPTVLVAPSWGPTCIFETIGTEVVRTLLDGGCRVIARPHPMTYQKTPRAMKDLVSTFGAHSDFFLDDDIVATHSLQESDVMVSDWSGAALEYAFGLERPVVFIDVARKVNNPDYASLGIEPFEASVREQIGVVVDPANLDALVPAVTELTRAPETWRARLQGVRDANIFNVGTSGAVAAQHIAAAAETFATAQGL